MSKQKVSKPNINYLYRHKFLDYSTYTMYYYLNEMLHSGVAEWQDNIDYKAGKAIVQWEGKLYQSLTDSNGGNPSTNPSDWKIFESGGGGSGDIIPRGGDCQVLGYDSNTVPVPITLDWKHISGSPIKPTSEKSVMLYVKGSDPEQDITQSWLAASELQYPTSLVLRDNGGRITAAPATLLTQVPTLNQVHEKLNDLHDTITQEIATATQRDPVEPTDLPPIPEIIDEYYISDLYKSLVVSGVFKMSHPYPEDPDYPDTQS